MPVLRINQHRGDALHHYGIEITATDIPHFAPLQFSRDIAFELTPQDGERIRWYLEDYTRLDVKCSKCGAPNRVSAEVDQVRAEYACKECGHKQKTL